jgi:hypothetical protein
LILRPCSTARLTAGFLNDIVAQLWPNICVAGATMTKAIAEPMFASMLPSPLNSLHFAKIDLGKVPLKLGNVDVHKTENGSIKMDLDVDWDGECDIELDGTMIPKIGIEHIKLNGRLSVLLGPLTNTIPLVCETSYEVTMTTPRLPFTDTRPDRRCAGCVHQPALPQVHLHRRREHCQCRLYRRADQQDCAGHHGLDGRPAQPLPRQA